MKNPVTRKPKSEPSTGPALGESGGTPVEHPGAVSQLTPLITAEQWEHMRDPQQQYELYLEIASLRRELYLYLTEKM